MFPCRYGRRNVVNRCSVVNRLTRGVPLGVLCGGGLLVQILGSGRVALCEPRFLGGVVCGVGDKPSAY